MMHIILEQIQQTIMDPNPYLGDDFRYHYFYSISNIINDKIYLGIHSTKNLDDGYLGSGTLIKQAIIKYGQHSFNKTIMGFFKNRHQLLLFEQNTITESIVLDRQFYNRVKGGGAGTSHKGLVKMINKITGEEEFKPVNYKDNWTPFSSNKFIAKDSNNIPVFIDRDDERVKSGELVHYTKDTIPVKDKFGKCSRVPRNDSRLKTGELIPMWKGKKHSDNTIAKLKEIQKSMIWISNIEMQETKKILLEELDTYLMQDWIRGRKFGIWNAGPNKGI